MRYKGRDITLVYRPPSPGWATSLTSALTSSPAHSLTSDHTGLFMVSRTDADTSASGPLLLLFLLSGCQRVPSVCLPSLRSLLRCYLLSGAILSTSNHTASCPSPFSFTFLYNICHHLASYKPTLEPKLLKGRHCLCFVNSLIPSIYGGAWHMVGAQ